MRRISVCDDSEALFSLGDDNRKETVTCSTWIAHIGLLVYWAYDKVYWMIMKKPFYFFSAMKKHDYKQITTSQLDVLIKESLRYLK